MNALDLSLFGGFSARRQSGAELSFPTKKCRLILARLALPAGSVVSRESLIGLLWSETGQTQARASLRQSLTALRKALHGIAPPILEIDGEAISLNPKAVQVDVGEFERLAASDTRQDLEQAAQLYRGAFLAGISVRDRSFEQWVGQERDRLSARNLQVLSQLLERATADRDLDHAIGFAQHLLAHDPFREDVHRALMRLYVEQGQRALALKQFELCRTTFEQELGVLPEAETEQLYSDIRAPRVPVVATPEPEVTTPSAARAEPVKPSIAVLPFVNRGDGAEQDYFSDGITEDIIIQLSRFSTLFVIARNTSFAYREQAGNVTTVARELGVHYIVEGSVQKAGERIRINVQLVDGVTGHHIWVERYDRMLEDIFELQDEVTQTIAATLAGRLEVAGQKRAKRKNTESLEAYDYVLRGNECFYRFTKPDNETAREMYRQSIGRDADCARAHLGLAWARLMSWMCHWEDGEKDTLGLALASAKQALSLDDNDSLNHAILGELFLFHREFERAKIHLDRALALNPNDADAIGIMGFLLTCMGLPDEGIQHFKRAKRLNPFQPDLCMFCWRFGIAQYTARRYQSAVTAMKEIVSPINDVRGWLAASMAQAGKDSHAHNIMNEFFANAETNEQGPASRALSDWKPYWAKYAPFRNYEDLEHLFEGLHKAGMR